MGPTRCAPGAPLPRLRGPAPPDPRVPLPGRARRPASCGRGGTRHRRPAAPDLGGEIGDLKIIAARRTTYELVLRRAALRSPLVTLKVGVAVRALHAVPGVDGSPPQVTGVELGDGTAITADAVVASSVRTATSPRWLGPHGVDIPEIVARTGITYSLALLPPLPRPVPPGRHAPDGQPAGRPQLLVLRSRQRHLLHHLRRRERRRRAAASPPRPCAFRRGVPDAARASTS